MAAAFIFIQDALLCERKWIKHALRALLHHLDFDLDLIAAALLILLAFTPKTNVQRGITRHYRAGTVHR